MQFSTLVLTAAAATLASAVKLTNSDFVVTAGSPFNITWSDADGAVTLLLKNGPSTDLTTVSTIGSGLTGTSYLWTPSSSLDSSLYAIEIQDSTSTPNYSEQFQVSGATAVASTVTASSTSVASSASGSSTTSGSSTASSTGSSAAASSAAASSTSGASTSNGTSTSATSSSPTASSNISTTLSTSSSASRTSSSSSRTSSSSSTGGTSSATSAPTSAAAEFASPLAFIFLAFAAIVTLN